MKEFIKINKHDNVVVALTDLRKGQIIQIQGEEVELKEDIKKGHKIAIKDIVKNEDIIKYGFPIGHAIKHIYKGEFIHSHNIKTNLSSVLNYEFNQSSIPFNQEKNRNLTFKGYRRENGEIGIRNELWIVPTVGCVNGVADSIIERFKMEEKVENIDSIVAFKHSYGCSQLGDDHINTRNILQGLVNHPNSGGVLVLGLGCENNQIETFKDTLGEFNEKRVKFLVCQDVENEIEEGVKILKVLYENMKNDKRKDIPLSELKVGLKCGGSDGLSGITVNPLVGIFSDFLISQGGTTILTEVPEMFGAETILMERAEDLAIFNKTVDLVNDFKKYFMSYGEPVCENPSPGNKAGGITTLEEKSLGCVQKGGKARVVNVLKYGERLDKNKKGLNLLSAPGNDLVASTAIAASGCHMVLFTTGRGTPFGTCVPTIKISTNTEIFNRKPHWIDFNAGILIEDKLQNDILDTLINYVIKVASGEFVNNERNNFREIAILKNGVTL
ncbi:UxaA family hydrolase [Clostridium lundense]|uniref:UxaA family hydrolase n=1 Tax=Clostridium lundense TaxID=319475 RepID=UPI000483AA8B|nr:altronate dehydratase family protein [Clostridium lundense]